MPKKTHNAKIKYDDVKKREKALLEKQNPTPMSIIRFGGVGGGGGGGGVVLCSVHLFVFQRYSLLSRRLFLP